MRQIVWSDYAKESLQNIVDFLEVHWGVGMKYDVIKLVDKRINQVCLNPNIAPNVNVTPYKRLFIHKNMTLFYILQPNAIKIVLAWDNRQDPNELLKVLTRNK